LRQQDFIMRWMDPEDYHPRSFDLVKYGSPLEYAAAQFRKREEALAVGELETYGRRDNRPAAWRSSRAADDESSYLRSAYGFLNSASDGDGDGAWVAESESAACNAGDGDGNGTCANDQDNMPPPYHFVSNRSTSLPSFPAFARRWRDLTYIPVERVSDISPLEFLHRFALRGLPVVVEDALDTWPCLNWTKQSLDRKFSRELAADEARWGNDSVSGMWQPSDPKVRAVMKREYGVPYFMDLGLISGGQGRSDLHRPRLGEEMLYYSPGRQFATPRHVDATCDASWSAQLQGEKQWLLWPTPGAAAAGVMPMHTVLRPGDMIVFYTGWHHEAQNLAEEPSLSLSQFWSGPVSAPYLEANKDYLKKCGKYSKCGARWMMATGARFDKARASRASVDCNALSDG